MPNNKLESLEFLRGFAALYVCAHHFVAAKLMTKSGFLAVIFGFGQEAVILFFLLSGFVISVSYQRSSDKSFTLFFVKRLLRIFPILLLTMILSWLIVSLNVGYIITPSIWELLGNIVMLQDIAFLKPGVLFNTFLGNSPLWSLGYEWWFYMLLIPVLFIRQRFGGAIPSLLFFVAACLYVVTQNHIPRVISYMSIWWLGVEMGLTYFSQKKITICEPNIKNAVLGLFAVVALYGLSAMVGIYTHTFKGVGYSPFLEFRHVFVALILGLLVIFYGSFLESIWQFIRESAFAQFFVWFSSISYAIYVFHFPLLVKFEYPVVISPLIFVLLVGLSWLCERPLTSYINKKSKAIIFNLKKV